MTQTRKCPTLAEMIAAFNPSITKEEAEKRASEKKTVEIKFTIEDVTPEGYGN